MDHPLITARKELTALGLVEDSGERRPDPHGQMQIVWRLSPRGLLIGDYQERFGLSFAQAVALLADDSTKVDA